MPLRIFQSAVNQQCDSALVSLQDLASALQNKDAPRVWNSLQSFLIAAANVSKLLWGPRPQIKRRPQELRESLGLGDDSPLRDRSLRNHFEHFDQRLETWALSSRRHNFVDGVIGPIDAVIQLPDASDLIRGFDPSAFLVRFQGDDFLLEPLAIALEDVWQRVRVEAGRDQIVPHDASLVPYLPGKDDPRPFSQAVDAIRAIPSAGGIRIFDPEPPPDPPTREDDVEVLRNLCEEVLQPLVAFLRVREQNYPYSRHTSEGVSFDDPERIQESKSYGEETVAFFNRHFRSKVTSLYRRMKENGHWDPNLESLCEDLDLNVAAFTALVHKLQKLCARVTGYGMDQLHIFDLMDLQRSAPPKSDAP